VIIQDNAFNHNWIGTIASSPLTTKLSLENAPRNVFLDKAVSALSKNSVVVVSRLCTIVEIKLTDRAGKIDSSVRDEMEDGIRLVLGKERARKASTLKELAPKNSHSSHKNND